MTVTVATLGFPRIGPRRELKTALESHWAGKTDAAALLVGRCRPSRPDVEASARSRRRHHPVQRFLALRPRAGYDRDGRALSHRSMAGVEGAVGLDDLFRHGARRCRATPTTKDALMVTRMTAKAHLPPR